MVNFHVFNFKFLIIFHFYENRDLKLEPQVKTKDVKTKYQEQERIIFWGKNFPIITFDVVSSILTWNLNWQI